MVAVDLDRLAAEVVDELAPISRREDVAVRLQTSGAARTAGHAEALRVLIRNLVERAILYSPAGGEVEVSVAEDSNRLLLRVCDNGPGIAEEELERVFDRFYRGSGKGGLWGRDWDFPSCAASPRCTRPGSSSVTRAAGGARRYGSVFGGPQTRRPLRETGDGGSSTTVAGTRP